MCNIIIIIVIAQPDVLSVAAASSPAPVAVTKTNHKSGSISRRPPAVATVSDCLSDCYHLFLVHSNCVFLAPLLHLSSSPNYIVLHLAL